MITATISAQKERPILFNTAMVKANNALIKTQTRRLIDPQPPVTAEYFGEGTTDLSGTAQTGFVWQIEAENEVIKFWPAPEDLYCPFGQVGDLLWVRETFYAYGYWILLNGKWKFIDETWQVGNYQFCDSIPPVVFSNRNSGIGWYNAPQFTCPGKPAGPFWKLPTFALNACRKFLPKMPYLKGLRKFQ